MQDHVFFGMAVADLIGLVAGTLTTASFLPQVIQTWRTRSALDISLTMFICFCIGTILWLACGIMMGAVPVIVANVVTLVLAGTILVFKPRCG